MMGATLRNESEKNKKDKMQDFLYHLQKRRLSYNALAVKNAFNRLRHPLPDNGAFYASYDSGDMVFSNPQAFIIRLRHRHQNLINHPLVLQPIATRDVGKMKLDIMPGVVCPAPQDVVKTLRRKLFRAGLKFSDPYARNTGLLPDGSPVVIDMGAVERLSGLSRFVAKILDRIRPSAPYPEDGFAPLREAFSAAWPKDQNADTPHDLAVEGMDAFLDLCTDMKKKNKLVDGWNIPSTRISVLNGIRAAAQKYKQQLQSIQDAPSRQNNVSPVLELSLSA